MVAKEVAERRPVVHRVLYILMASVVSANELGKLAWSRWQSQGFGYWWVAIGGFSVGEEGAGGVLLDALAALTVALVLFEVLLELIVELPAGRSLAIGLHFTHASLLAALSATDLALFVGAGGARVSLPLIMFALSETQYALHVVTPWLRVAAAALLLIAAVTAALGTAVAALVRRLAPSRRTPWLMKLGLLVFGLRRLWITGDRSRDGVGADLISQLSIDFKSMVYGNLFSAPLADTLEHNGVEVDRRLAQYPPLLLYHWEAGSADLLYNQSSRAVPYLRRVADRADVVATQAVVSMPMTLKSAWEVLCGVQPSLTSDFREHGSLLRRECLPRVLRRCCRYHSILAKTDTQLPELPRRVFGFDEIMVAPTTEELLQRLEARLSSLGALHGSKPAMVYFYSDDAHAPYHATKVDASERGYSQHLPEDVFLALHRRADNTAEQLGQFWPPRPAPGAAWAPEHGMTVFFGDHGELLDSTDPPPHGNSVIPSVTQALLVAERRAFAPPASSTNDRAADLRRLADIYATVLDVVGLKTYGSLNRGLSLLHPGSHGKVVTYSFYRPSDIMAVGFPSGDASSGAKPSVCFAEFERSQRGWILKRLTGPGFGPNANSCSGNERAGKPSALDATLEAARAHALMKDALADRNEINSLMTESNVHAAWIVAQLAATARKAKALARFVVTKILQRALPGFGENASSWPRLAPTAGMVSCGDDAEADSDNYSHHTANCDLSAMSRRWATGFR